MTWVRGSTTIANAKSDLYNLITGAAAAASTGGGGSQTTNSATVASGDAWIGIGVTEQVIRSPLTQASVYGTWNFWRGKPRCEYRTVDPGTSLTLGKPTFTGTLTGGGRAYFLCYVTTSNSSPGTLGGLVVQWYKMDLTPAGTYGTTLFSGTLTGWSGSSATVLIRDGISLTLTLNAGETLPSGSSGGSAISWFRGYSATYPNGIDYYPDAGKIDTSQSTSSINVVTNASSYVAGTSTNYVRGTDYDLVGECDTYPYLGTSSSSLGLGSFSGNSLYGPGIMHGIHWKTGGSPPSAGTLTYVLNAQCFVAYAKLDFTNTGIFTLQPCEYYFPGDTTQTPNVPALPRHTVSGDNAFTTAAAYQSVTPYTGSGVTNSNWVNYWMSVKNGKIVIYLQGDAATYTSGYGPSGGYTTFQKYTPYTYNTSEKTPWIVWSSNTTGGSMAVAGWWPNNYVNGHTVFTNTGRQQWINNDLSYFGLAPNNLIGANPNPQDGSWDLYQIGVSSVKNGKDTAGTISINRSGGFKGLLQGVYEISIDNWVNFNELLVGGVTYFLTTTTLYTGSSMAASAILEE